MIKCYIIANTKYHSHETSCIHMLCLREYTQLLVNCFSLALERLISLDKGKTIEEFFSAASVDIAPHVHFLIIFTAINEPPRGNTNNVVFEQVGYKSGCTVTEKT